MERAEAAASFRRTNCRCYADFLGFNDFFNFIESQKLKIWRERLKTWKGFLICRYMNLGLGFAVWEIEIERARLSFFITHLYCVMNEGVEYVLTRLTGC